MKNKAGKRGVSTLMHYVMVVLLLVCVAVPVFIIRGASAEASAMEDCITRHQKKARCQVAKYIINDACKCKFDDNCKYPNRKAIDCILENIGEVSDNSAAYLMRNSCIEKSLLSGPQ